MNADFQFSKWCVCYLASHHVAAAGVAQPVGVAQPLVLWEGRLSPRCLMECGVSVPWRLKQEADTAGAVYCPPAPPPRRRTRIPFPAGTKSPRNGMKTTPPGVTGEELLCVTPWLSRGLVCSRNPWKSPLGIRGFRLSLLMCRFFSDQKWCAFPYLCLCCAWPERETPKNSPRLFCFRIGRCDSDALQWRFLRFPPNQKAGGTMAEWSLGPWGLSAACSPCLVGVCGPTCGEGPSTRGKCLWVSSSESGLRKKHCVPPAFAGCFSPWGSITELESGDLEFNSRPMQSRNLFSVLYNWPQAMSGEPRDRRTPHCPVPAGALQWPLVVG